MVRVRAFNRRIVGLLVANAVASLCLAGAGERDSTKAVENQIGPRAPTLISAVGTVVPPRAREMTARNEEAQPKVQSSAPVDETPRPGGKLDLRLKASTASLGVEGTWTYQPFDGSEPYAISIRRSKDGFYQFEGRGTNRDRPVLQFDKVEDPAVYRGQVGEGFDSCIPAGARFSLFLSGEALVFEPSMPVDNPVPRGLPGRCSESAKYFLAARGRGEEIKLHPQADLAGAAAQIDARSDSSTHRPGSARASENAPAASLSIGAPAVPDGTQVLLLGSLRDGNAKVWHHVKLLAPIEKPDENDKSGQDGAGKKDNDPPTRLRGEKEGSIQGGPSSASPKGSTNGDEREARSTRDGPGRDSRAKDSDKAVKRKEPSEPPSGYVAAASVVVRWDCRLVRRDRSESQHSPEDMGSHDDDTGR